MMVIAKSAADAVITKIIMAMVMMWIKMIILKIATESKKYTP